ncbi:hypothetical protein AAVH_43621, partial [Aphelenchoides avenae]
PPLQPGWPAMAREVVPRVGVRGGARGRRGQRLRGVQPVGGPARVSLHNAPGAGARRGGARRRQLPLPSALAPRHRRLGGAPREAASDDLRIHGQAREMVCEDGGQGRGGLPRVRGGDARGHHV